MTKSMNIYISHKRKSEFEKELYEPLRNSDLAKEHRFIFPHAHNPEAVNAKGLFHNKEVDLVIAEVSYPATGQGIELGWADIYGIPIVCIYRQGAEIAGTLSFVTNKLLMYTSTENMIEDIRGVLKQYA